MDFKIFVRNGNFLNFDLPANGITNEKTKMLIANFETFAIEWS